MSLSRWSNSEFYIYDVDDDRLQVSLFGHFTIYSILNRYKVIERRAVREGYSLLCRLELRCYLKLWANFKTGKISYKRLSFLLKLLRNYGRIKFYILHESDDLPEME